MFKNKRPSMGGGAIDGSIMWMVGVLLAAGLLSRNGCAMRPYDERIEQ